MYVKDVQISGGESLPDNAALQQQQQHQQQQQQQQQAGAKPSQRELPTCPVCLERLDEPTSGVVTTVCSCTMRPGCTLELGRRQFRRASPALHRRLHVW